MNLEDTVKKEVFLFFKNKNAGDRLNKKHAFGRTEKRGKERKKT